MHQFRHCLMNTLSSISSMSNQLLCLGMYLQPTKQPPCFKALKQVKHGSRGTRECLRGLRITPLQDPRIDLPQHMACLILYAAALPLY